MSQPIDEATVRIIPDLSEFGRLLRTELDQALRGVQTAVASAFARIEQAAAQAGAGVGEAFQLGGEEADAAFAETSRTARREFAEIEASATRTSAGISARLGGALEFVKSGLLTVGTAAAAGLGAITFFGLKSAASLEQTTIGFKALLGSADAANTFIQQLQSFAAATPFEFLGVSDAARRILAFGSAVGIARDQVIPTLTTIGDLVSVLGGGQAEIDSVVRALGQMASAAHVNQQDVMQLAQALPGFNVNAEIAKSLGISTGEALDRISSGALSGADGVNIILKAMAKFPGAAGAMAEQAQTLTGVFSTFKDTVSIALTNAFQPVIPQIKSTLTELTPVIGSAIGELAPALGGALAHILPIIGKLIQAIVPILTPILDALGPALDALGPALVPLGEAIGQVLIALGPSLPLLGQFVAALAQLAVPVLLLLAEILKPLTPLINFMTSAIAEFNKALGMIDWAGVGRAIATWTMDAWKNISDFFTNWAKGIFNFGAMIGAWFRQLLDSAWNNILETVNIIGSLPGRAVAALEGIGAALVQRGRELISGLWAGISAMGGWLWNQITGFIDRFVTGPVKEALGIHSPSQVMADEVGTQIPAGIEQGVKAGAPSLENVMAALVPVGQAAAPATGLGLGSVTINLIFNGSAPSVDDARRAGVAAADALMGRITSQRNIGLAVRTA